MIITAAHGVIEADRGYVLTANGITLYWVGFIHSRGYQAGHDTARFIAEHFVRTGTVPFSLLRGSFTAFVVSADRILAFADNSGLSTVFIHANAIGDRFLPLIQHIGRAGASLTLDSVAVAQTYAIGRVLSGRTLIDSVAMLDKDHYVESREGQILTHEKCVPGIDASPTGFSPGAFFDSLAATLPPDATSCALTGGYDSRLVYAFLSNRTRVWPTLSGDNRGGSEASVSAQVAESSGSELTFVNVPRPAMDEDLVDRLFWEQDGAAGFSSDSSIRLFKFYEALRRRGAEMHLTGDGGVLHKDWEWIQDFPFYKRRRTNLGRFYDHRLGFNFDADAAGPTIEPLLRTMRRDTLERLREYRMGSNTQTYDMLYYHINGRRTVYYNSRPHGLSLYAPLLEREFVAYSYALPRSKRFFNNSIREMTTSEQPRLARIATVYGTTASSEPAYICRDVLFQLVDYGRRALRLLGRKVLRRTPMLEPAVSWSVEADLRELPLVSEAVKYCRSIGVIASDAPLSTLSRPHIDVAIQVLLVSRVAGLAAVDAD